MRFSAECIGEGSEADRKGNKGSGSKDNLCEKANEEAIPDVQRPKNERQSIRN